MKCWSIISADAFEELHAMGSLFGQSQFACADFLPAYDWMRGQMVMRLGKRPSPSAYPIWVWVQWQDKDHKKPDLRSMRHTLTKAKFYRLELDIPAHEVLLSDFDDWHCVLNDTYLAADEADFDQFYEALGPGEVERPPNIQKAIEESWTRIFDINGPHIQGWNNPIEGRSIQGTTWQISTDQIQKVTEFYGTEDW